MYEAHTVHRRDAGGAIAEVIDQRSVAKDRSGRALMVVHDVPDVCMQVSNSRILDLTEWE